ncbi:MAG: hypothetical protein WC682_00985 [Parcubacteria group bacterium]|jgi:hypothetical protein
MNGQWFFECLLHITGETCVGDSFSGSKKLLIPLFATSIEDAEKQAILATTSFDDTDFLNQYCGNVIGGEDGVRFSDFRIYCEKILNIHVAHIDSGP